MQLSQHFRYKLALILEKPFFYLHLDVSKSAKIHLKKKKKK
jgi:hypothetical protein